MPEAVKNAYNNDPFQDFELLHAVYPRDKYNPQQINNENKVFASVWYLTASSKVISESGFDEFPYTVWRYMRGGIGAYGLCPAILAMADTKGCNIISKTLYGAAQLHNDPPLNVPSDMQGKVQWKPRGLNYYDKENMIIKPANVGGNFPIGLEWMEKIEQSIRERFHVDTFLMLTQMDRGAKTAYEVSEMMGEKAAILGAELAPLNNVMDSILDLVYSMLAKRHPENDGSITPRPDILYELAMEGDSFSPQYDGPLAQAQRRMFKTQGINAGLGLLGPVLEVFPESKDKINGDEIVNVIMEAHNFPQRTIRTNDEVTALRQARQEAMAAENQKQDMLDMADGVKTMADANATSEGAIAQGITQAMGGQA
jgi:hypothetical protein